MNQKWMTMVIVGLLVQGAAFPTLLAKEILAPNVGSEEPGVTPGQASELGQLPVGDVAGTSPTQEEAKHALPCPRAGANVSLNSRNQPGGLELLEECKPNYLPTPGVPRPPEAQPQVGLAGQAAQGTTVPHPASHS